MKIMLIGHEKGLNGASRSLLNVADELSERGHSVYVLSSFNSGMLFEELRRHKIEVIVEPFYLWCQQKGDINNWEKKEEEWRREYNAINKKTAKHIAQYAVDNNIDIIHSNTSVINIGGLISKYSGIKHVWHIREFADLDFNIYPLIPRKKCYKFMNRYTDRFICVSKAVADHYDMLDSEKKEVIYNGISITDSLSSDITNHEDNISRILIAGAIYPGKGQHEAVAACAELYKQGINDYELLIAGEGKKYFSVPDELQDHVRFLGQVEDMASLRKTIDINLMCSRAEAFGRVTVEAMMSGIPVIGSNSGGTPELIQDGVTGFLYESGNIEELAEKIIILMNNKELRERMGKAGREYAEKNFTIERCVDKIEEVYRNLLNTQ